MKINPAKHTVCEKGHMYRHKKHDSCPVCLNNKLQIQRNDSIKNKLSGLTYPQQKLLRDYPLTYNVCVVHNQFHSISEGCPKCITSLNYCGKFMYTREQAKERVRKSRGNYRAFIIVRSVMPTM